MIKCAVAFLVVVELVEGFVLVVVCSLIVVLVLVVVVVRVVFASATGCK